jgi:hypothetical protein
MRQGGDSVDRKNSSHLVSIEHYLAMNRSRATCALACRNKVFNRFSLPVPCEIG